MKTTREFLAAIKHYHGLKTDGDLHRFLGVSRERISRYQHGQDYFGDETAIKVAEALGLDPGYVMSCTAAERARRPAVRKVWEKVARVIGGATVWLLYVTIIGVQLAHTTSPDISVMNHMLTTALSHMDAYTLYAIAAAMALAGLTLALCCVRRHRLVS